jgi:hypothetical protein
LIQSSNVGAQPRVARDDRRALGFRRARLVGCSALLGCVFRPGNSSPGSGGTSGTRFSIRSTSLGSARLPRSCKYSTVSSAAVFSATAVAMN